MTRPNGGWRCSYGAWHDLYEECKCWETTAAVMHAAFGGPGRVFVTSDNPCDYYTPCEHRAWGQGGSAA